MPFIQRIVQPIHVAQATAASLGQAGTRFQCQPGKCRNNNCINKQTTDEGAATSPSLTRALVHHCEQDQQQQHLVQDHAPRPPASLPMKKLKQHVEFMPSTSPTRTTPTSPTRLSASQSLPNSRHPSQQRVALPTRNASAPQSPSHPNPNSSASVTPRVISGYEFDSISNITSNVELACRSISVANLVGSLAI